FRSNGRFLRGSPCGGKLGADRGVLRPPPLRCRARTLHCRASAYQLLAPRLYFGRQLLDPPAEDRPLIYELSQARFGMRAPLVGKERLSLARVQASPHRVEPTGHLDAAPPELGGLLSPRFRRRLRRAPLRPGEPLLLFELLTPRFRHPQGLLEAP